MTVAANKLHATDLEVTCWPSHKQLQIPGQHKRQLVPYKLSADAAVWTCWMFVISL